MPKLDGEIDALLEGNRGPRARRLACSITEFLPLRSFRPASNDGAWSTCYLKCFESRSQGLSAVSRIEQPPACSLSQFPSSVTPERSEIGALNKYLIERQTVVVFHDALMSHRLYGVVGFVTLEPSLDSVGDRILV